MDLENLLYRIINGYYTINIDKHIYKVVLPTVTIKQNAYDIYLTTIDEHKFDTSSWITEKSINNLLKIYDIWDEELEKQLEKLLEDLNTIKIQLYSNYLNSQVRTLLKDKINSTNSAINILYNKKHNFDYLTLEYYAQNVKNQYLITNMVYTVDNKKIFDYNNFDGINSGLLEKILVEIHQNNIDTSTIKKLARHDSWRSFWNISKENIFEGKIKDWTDEQRSLVNFSKVLDSIREHMEAPSEDIISDDDALDGWILYHNKKNETEKNKKYLSDKYGLDNKNAGELFVITTDKEEAKAIMGLNDVQTKKDIKEMIKISNEKGSVNWSELPHVRRDLQSQVRTRNK